MAAQSMALAVVDVYAMPEGDHGTIYFPVVRRKNATIGFPECHRRHEGGWNVGARNPLLCRFIPVRHQDVGVNRRVTTPRTLRVGPLNMCSCGTDEIKREMIGKMFVSRKLDVLAMSETKMQGKGEREFGPVLGRVFDVDGGRGREGVGLHLSDVMKKNVKE